MHNYALRLTPSLPKFISASEDNLELLEIKGTNHSYTYSFIMGTIRSRVRKAFLDQIRIIKIYLKKTCRFL